MILQDSLPTTSRFLTFRRSLTVVRLHFIEIELDSYGNNVKCGIHLKCPHLKRKEMEVAMRMCDHEEREVLTAICHTVTWDVINRWQSTSETTSALTIQVWFHTYPLLLLILLTNSYTRQVEKITQDILKEINTCTHLIANGRLYNWRKDSTELPLRAKNWHVVVRIVGVTINFREHARQGSLVSCLHLCLWVWIRDWKEEFSRPPFEQFSELLSLLIYSMRMRPYL